MGGPRFYRATGPCAKARRTDCDAGGFALVVTETRLRELPGVGDCLDRVDEPVADMGPYQALEPRPRPPRPD